MFAFSGVLLVLVGAGIVYSDSEQRKSTTDHGAKSDDQTGSAKIQLESIEAAESPQPEAGALLPVSFFQKDLW